MQKKNIAIMIPKLNGGGAERVAANLSTYLSNEKYRKKVITFDSSNAGYDFEGEIIDLNTKVKHNLFGKMFNIIKRIYLTRKLKKKKDIDVTISLLEGPNLINLLSRKNDRIVISVRHFPSIGSEGFHWIIHKFLIKTLYNRADDIVVVSKAIKRDLIDNFGIKENKITVIYNFYDIGKIQTLANEPISSTEKRLFTYPTIITAGRLSEQKGHWHLIRAFKHIKQSIPKAKLIILGEGYLENYLKKLSKDLKLENDIFFLGFKNNPFKYFAEADIYAFPSLSEGFPNALCEAMLCGLPVISSDCESGPREILSSSLPVEEPVIQETFYTDYGVLLPVCDGALREAQEPLTKEEILWSKEIVNLFERKDVLKQYRELSLQRMESFHTDNGILKWDMLVDS